MQILVWILLWLGQTEASFEDFIRELSDNFKEHFARCLLIICTVSDSNYCPVSKSASFTIPVAKFHIANNAVDFQILAIAQTCQNYILEGISYDDILPVIELTQEIYQRGGPLLIVAHNQTIKQVSQFFSDQRVSKFSKLSAASKLQTQNEIDGNENFTIALFRKQLCGTKNGGLWPQNHIEDLFNYEDKGDSSCILLRGTAFPYAPYTKLDESKSGSEAYSGFEVQVLIHM